LELSCGECPFAPGDRMLLFTDGVLELKNSRNREFGIKNVAKFLQNIGSRSTEQVRDDLVAHLEQYRETVPADDDITLVIVDRI
jgi:serine phosphatase RsbU (regulator of sigma subunit)